MLRSFTELAQQFKEYLDAQDWDREPKNLYEPIEYILHLGGKRVRPTLCLASAQLFGSSSEVALNQALAVEVFHNFTLMHDDIMDVAPLRRGQATVHEKWDANSAILSGDAMMILSYELLARNANEKLSDLLQIFNQTAIDVCRGQQMDMDFEKRKTVEKEEYLEMIRLKTAVLLAGSLEMGAIMAGAGPERKQLAEFGLKIGLSFQIQDDILDAFGEAKSFGKREGGDINANKKTILFAIALEDGNEAQKDQLLQAYSSPSGTEGKIEQVLELYADLAIQRKAQALMHSYHQKALNILDELNLPEENKEALREVAAQLLVRKV